MGKTVNNPKTHVLSFRVDEAGREAIDTARGSQSVSEYVLGLINKAQGCKVAR